MTKRGASQSRSSISHYEHADLALQAAVLAHGIAEAQPFLDGNKRRALVALVTCLEIKRLPPVGEPGRDLRLAQRRR